MSRRYSYQCTISRFAIKLERAQQDEFISTICKSNKFSFIMRSQTNKRTNEQTKKQTFIHLENEIVLIFLKSRFGQGLPGKTNSDDETFETFLRSTQQHLATRFIERSNLFQTNSNGIIIMLMRQGTQKRIFITILSLFVFVAR